MMRGYTADKDKLQARPRRIEGQIRGLQRLVEEDTYCIESSMSPAGTPLLG